MTFEIKSDGVDVAALMEAIRKRIEEKKKQVSTKNRLTLCISINRNTMAHAPIR